MKMKNLLVTKYSELSRILVIHVTMFQPQLEKSSCKFTLQSRQKEGKFLSLKFSETKISLKPPDEIPACLLSFKWPSSSTIFCKWFLIVLGLDFFLFESLCSFHTGVWDLTYRWKMACDSKVINYISLDSGLSVKDYPNFQNSEKRWQKCEGGKLFALQMEKRSISSLSCFFLCRLS